jgi:hypothetical protein
MIENFFWISLDKFTSLKNFKVNITETYCDRYQISYCGTIRHQMEKNKEYPIYSFSSLFNNKTYASIRFCFPLHERDDFT